MGRIVEYSGPVYLPIKEAVKITGLSSYYLRSNVKDGKIAHIMSGNKVFIHIYKLFEQLDRSSQSKDGE